MAEEFENSYVLYLYVSVWLVVDAMRIMNRSQRKLKAIWKGHFTQVVWKSSERVGVGEAGQAGGYFYVVAAYYPSGNSPGEFKKNVLPRIMFPPSCIDKLPNITILEKWLHYPRESFIDFSSSEPCNLTALLGHNEAQEVGTENTATQGKDGTSESTTTSEAESKAGGESKPLMVIPIGEPQVIQQPSQIPNAQTATSLPSVTGPTQLNPSSSPTTTTSSPLSSAAPVMNPARATNAIDPTLGRRTKLHSRLKVSSKQKRLRATPLRDVTGTIPRDGNSQTSPHQKSLGWSHESFHEIRNEEHLH